VNPHKFSAIAHRDHDYCNPITAAKIERLLDLLQLGAGASVLDLGCGRGELSLRVIERFGCLVTAIDRSSPMLDAARKRLADRWAPEAHAELHLGMIGREPEGFEPLTEKP